MGKHLANRSFREARLSPINYRKVNIPKGRKGVRSLYIPNEELKSKLRSFLPHLQRIAMEQDQHNVCHAFIKGRNCVTNAQPHVGYKYSVSLDIEDFFDSIRRKHVDEFIEDELISLCFIDGAPRQGLPTSPLIANIALSAVDRSIYKSLGAVCGIFSYTRYADDITISFNNNAEIKKVIFIVRNALISEGFRINERKTKVQCSVNGRRIITGVGVDEKGVHPTRKALKSLRAASHQNNLSSVRGLIQWVLCKAPGLAKIEIPELYRNQVDGKAVACHYCL
ncbi:MAG: reverse transcriptase family protein, partial [Pseudomonadales bacterium]|nr:reverse transcriptase family protein [Pseudomonadales bacterium]